MTKTQVNFRAVLSFRRPSSSHKRKAESLEMTQMSSGESEDGESSEDEPSPPVFRSTVLGAAAMKAMRNGRCGRGWSWLPGLACAPRPQREC